MQGHDKPVLGSASFESTLIKKPKNRKGSFSALKEKIYPCWAQNFFYQQAERRAYVALHKAAAALTHSQQNTSRKVFPEVSGP